MLPMQILVMGPTPVGTQQPLRTRIAGSNGHMLTSVVVSTVDGQIDLVGLPRLLAGWNLLNQHSH